MVLVSMLNKKKCPDCGTYMNKKYHRGCGYFWTCPDCFRLVEIPLVGESYTEQRKRYEAMRKKKRRRA